MSGIKTLRKIQWGKEATPGTQAVATAIYRGTGTVEDARKMGFPVEDIGLIMPYDTEYYTSQYLGNFNLGPDDASFEQLPYFFEAGIKKLGTGVADGGGGSGKIYAYPMSLASQNTLQYLSIEGGDDNQVDFGTYGFFKEITLDGKWGEPLKVSAKGTTRTFDHDAQATGTGIAFDNANHITDSNSGFTVAAGFSASMKIRVSGSVANDGIFTVTARADGQLTVTETTVTGIAGPNVVVQQYFTPSIAMPVVERIIFTKSKLFLDAAGGTMGLTNIANTLKAMKCTIKTGANEVGGGNGDLNYAFVNIANPEVTVDVEFWTNSTMVIEKHNWRNSVARLLRLQVLGSALTTAGTAYGYRTLNMDLPGKWTKFSTLQDANGNNYVTGSFNSRYNPSSTIGPSFTVVNQLASLP
jgi:hypothetical protein